VTPKRIQRKRTKGWRMPEGAVYVGRPTKWGNPFSVGSFGFRLPNGGAVFYRGDGAPRAAVVELYRRWVVPKLPDLTPLRGHDLACWCPLDQPCHADVLLELANRRTDRCLT